MDSWVEDDEFEGVEPGDTIESRQEKAKKNGIMPVAECQWQEKVNRRISKITGRPCDDRVAAAIQNQLPGQNVFKQLPLHLDMTDLKARPLIMVSHPLGPEGVMSILCLTSSTAYNIIYTNSRG